MSKPMIIWLAQIPTLDWRFHVQLHGVLFSRDVCKRLENEILKHNKKSLSPQIVLQISLNFHYYLLCLVQFICLCPRTRDEMCVRDFVIKCAFYLIVAAAVWWYFILFVWCQEILDSRSFVLICRPVTVMTNQIFALPSAYCEVVWKLWAQLLVVSLINIIRDKILLWFSPVDHWCPCDIWYRAIDLMYSKPGLKHRIIFNLRINWPITAPPHKRWTNWRRTKCPTAEHFSAYHDVPVFFLLDFCRC